jgi:hypothetical protein
MDKLGFLQTGQEQGGFIFVKAISSALPHVDLIGHKILHANNEFINKVLDCEIAPHSIKEMAILSFIRLSIYGDEFGSALLHFYYNMVENSFKI